jgi:hypothetical protein
MAAGSHAGRGPGRRPSQGNRVNAHGELLRPIDSSAWQAALDQLLADATVQIEVTLPERRRPPPMPRYSHEIRHAVPIRRPEPPQEATPEIETPADPALPPV